MQRWHYILLLGLLVGGVAFYLWVDPATSSFAPQCIYHSLTGWECPACGAQRALHALLQGDFVAAFRFNPFLFILSPYILAVLYTTLSKSPRAQRWQRVVQHPAAILVAAILTFGWWILRNTTFWHNLIG